MSDLYQAVLRGADESTRAGEQIALNRATAAMNQLMNRITALREAEYQGWDSGQVIRARVSGTGRLSGGATPVDAPAELPDFCEYWRTKLAEQR